MLFRCLPQWLSFLITGYGALLLQLSVTVTVAYLGSMLTCSPTLTEIFYVEVGLNSVILAGERLVRRQNASDRIYTPCLKKLFQLIRAPSRRHKPP